MSNTDTLKDYIEKLSEKSSNGEISWVQINSSTFQWLQSIDGVEHVISIQKANSASISDLLGGGNNASKPTYLFQVTNKETKLVRVSISSKDRTNFQSDLSKLYSSAEEGADLASVGILKNLIGS